MPLPSPIVERTRRLHMVLVTLLTALIATACSKRAGAAPASLAETHLRRTGSAAARSDGLAAEWLIAAGGVPPHVSLPSTPRPLTAPLARRMLHHVLDHSWCAILACGDGPSLAGSARIRREALDPGAPVDHNANHTNLDETLAAELESLRSMCGAPSVDGVASILAPRRSGSAQLLGAEPIGTLAGLESLRTATDGTPRIDAHALGRALLLRAVLGQALGGARHGTEVGATSKEGLLALVAIEQALAIEETIFTDLSFDGEVFRPVQDPREYDPAVQALWIPSQLAWIPHDSLASTGTDWIAEDRASDLGDIAALMRGAVELGWLTDPTNPSPGLRALFVDTPLAPPGGGGPPRLLKTWVDDVRPILHGPAGCLACHSPPVLNSNFSVASYESVFLTGLSGVPGVRAGDHDGSALWHVVSEFWTPPGWGFPLARMPFGGPYLPQSLIDTIAQWIDDGAVREQPPQRPGPRPGLDLARVLFRNAIALHEVRSGPWTGLLDHRSGATPSGLADTHSTGGMLAALAALASFDLAEPGLTDALQRWAEAARQHLTLADGSVFGEFDLHSGHPTSITTDLGTRAALAAGLLAAGRTLGDGNLIARGHVVAARLVDDSWSPTAGLFGDRPGDATTVLRADDVAVVSGMLRELQLAGDDSARDIAERFASRLVTVFPFSEFDGDGEILGDGIADTDHNGVVEPDADRLAPRLADGAIEGPPRHADPTTPISWSHHVLPLFRQRCAGCHVDGLNEGGYRVDSAQLAARAGDSATSSMIVPGAPDRSFLIEKLSARRPQLGAQMPLDSPPLTSHEIGVVRAWIEQGARDR